VLRKDWLFFLRVLRKRSVGMRVMEELVWLVKGGRKGKEGNGGRGTVW